MGAPGKGGWLDRLKGGLGLSAAKLGQGLAGIFSGRTIDAATLEELEELLISADLGQATAAELVEALRRAKPTGEGGLAEIAGLLAREIAGILEPVARPLELSAAHRPFVILVAGVNGTGKTTTIGKLAARFRRAGKSVLLVAGDTFRAAAVEQLKVWGERAGAEVVAHDGAGGDPAGLAYDALEKARAAGTDVVLIDTAGRLQNKTALMDELKKIVRVLKKLDPSAPHASLLVLDATVGQNAHSQVEAFREAIAVSGLLLTKLDSSAKGGVAVALAKRFGLPIHAVGVGEGIDDLDAFEPQAFAAALVGLEPASR